MFAGSQEEFAVLTAEGVRTWGSCVGFCTALEAVAMRQGGRKL